MSATLVQTIETKYPCPGCDQLISVSLYSDGMRNTECGGEGEGACEAYFEAPEDGMIHYTHDTAWMCTKFDEV